MATAVLEPTDRWVPDEPELARLAELERTIATELSAYVAAGRALLEIRDRRLYRAAEFPVFRAYLEAR